MIHLMAIQATTAFSAKTVQTGWLAATETTQLKAAQMAMICMVSRVPIHCLAETERTQFPEAMAQTCSLVGQGRIRFGVHRA